MNSTLRRSGEHIRRRQLGRCASPAAVVSRARRTIKAVLVPAWIEFAGAVQVAQVLRTVMRKGKKTAGVVCLATTPTTRSGR